MVHDASPGVRREPSQRATLIRRLAGAYVGGGALLRIALLIQFRPERLRPLAFPFVLAYGLLQDVLVALVLAAPMATGLWLAPELLVRPAPLRALAAGALATGLAYLAAVEWYFFDEFSARFNHIALDYLVYPHEVFENIWQSFAVVRVLAASLAAGAVFGAWAALSSPGRRRDPAWSERAVVVFGALALGGAGLLALGALPDAFAEDRLASEIAGNGLVHLVHAFRTAALDYRTFYQTIPQPEARARAAAVLELPAPHEAELRAMRVRMSRIVHPVRRVAPVAQVVVILEESLGAEHAGCLGARPGDLTPQLDRWTHEGLLLTNLYANGNRTVRGLEGVLCSFVSLPGDSIVKRGKTAGVDSLAKAFGRHGFRTAFYYGGRGMFDNLRNFASVIGYQEFVEEADFPADAFRTAWGAADEHAFDLLLARQRSAREHHERLFATLLTVSNHKPFRVPDGRVAHPPGQGSGTRPGAVRYADWALGRYLDRARAEHLLDDAVVLIVGDHGARVYGSDRIPLASYRIPALFVVPDPLWKGVRQPRLASQIDLAPTLLSLAGIEGEVGFLGTDVCERPGAGGRAFLQHNHDLGLLTDERLVVLGLRRAVRSYARGARLSLTREAPSAATRAAERDAAAVFQIAEELYEQGGLAVHP